MNKNHIFSIIMALLFIIIIGYLLISSNWEVEFDTCFEYENEKQIEICQLKKKTCDNDYCYLQKAQTFLNESACAKIKDEELKIRFDTTDNLDEVRSEFLQNYRSVKFIIKNNIASITIDDLFKKSIQDAAIKQSLEIVRKRIDESGTKEPLIQRSGKSRILLQLPGVKDPERIKDLLGKTAKLNFHMVDDNNLLRSLSLKIAFNVFDSFPISVLSGIKSE